VIMDFIFILLGINTLLVFLYQREWLLQKRPFTILLAFNLILFVLGYVLQHFPIGNPKLIVALKMPVLSQLLFMGLITVFRKIYNRDPVDTFWSSDISLMKDGIFNFVFWVVAVVLPAILVFTRFI
jgi:hypothetical protein